MRVITGPSNVVAALAVILLASTGAFAYDATAFERAELTQLRPQLRSQVEARMTSGQTVRGILDTMLLNNVSQLFAANRVIAVDFAGAWPWLRGRTVKSRLSTSTSPRW